MASVKCLSRGSDRYKELRSLDPEGMRELRRLGGFFIPLSRHLCRLIGFL